MRQRARLDDLYYAIVTALRTRLKPEERAHRQALDELNEKLVDKYFVNFSIFESIPDSWAIDQIFPIVPISGLDRAPDRRGVIADLTCDSDGRIDHYVDAEGVDVSLPLHAPVPGESYRLGIFLVGAYQEALGDIHNLFGDTDAVNVRLTDGGGYEFSHMRRGDTTDVMLDYVGYDLNSLRARIATRSRSARRSPATWPAQLRATLEAGLTGYTYLGRERSECDMTDLHAGFVGLGAMGYPMAGHLKRAGLLVAVANRTAAKAQAFAARTRRCRAGHAGRTRANVQRDRAVRQRRCRRARRHARDCRARSGRARS